MKLKKIVALLITAAMLLTLAPTVFASVSVLSVGDVVQIGTYNGEPVKYKVMGTRDVNGDGTAELFLASTKIVSYKNFMEGKNPKYIVNWESNHKGRPSTLRTWLNSDAAAGAVDYKKDIDNTTASIYNDEAGFMSGMEVYEKNQIVPVTHRAKAAYDSDIAGGQYDVTDGGTNFSYNAHGLTWEKDAPYEKDVNGNKYSETRYVETTDKVFIPSIGDIYDFFGGSDADTVKANMNVGATEAAMATVTDESLYENSKTLLRDTYYSNQGDSKVHGWYSEDNLSLRSTNEVYGVRPCMYLKADTQVVLDPSNSDTVFCIRGSEVKRAEIGDIIQIGTYGEGDLKEPVEYKVMGSKDINNDGVAELYLASTKIVTFKEISAYGPVTWKGQIASTAATSDLREWLNSSDNIYTSNRTVKPSYNNTPGFMSLMTEYERLQIVPVTHESLVYVSPLDGSGNSDTLGTSTDFSTFNANWPNAYTGMETNYANLKHVVSTESVFIPSIKELYEFFGGNNISANINVEITKAAMNEVSVAGYATYKQQWTRDNTTSAINPVANRRVVFENNTVKTNILSVQEKLGVRPCMYIKADTELQPVSEKTGVYEIVPVNQIRYEQTSLGTVISAKIYNDGANTEKYTLFVAGYNNESKNLEYVRTYSADIAAGNYDTLSSDVINCGDTANYYRAFLWKFNTLTPLVEFFPIDVSE